MSRLSVGSLNRALRPLDEDVLFWYSAAQASADPLTDDGPNGYDISDGGGGGDPVAVAADLVNGQTNATLATRGAVRMVGFESWYELASTALRVTLQGEIGVIGVFNVEQSGSADLMYYGGSGTGFSSANNYQLYVDRNSTTLRIRWQYGTNAVETVDTGLTLPTDQTFMIGFALENDPDNASKRRCRAYVGRFDDLSWSTYTENNLNLATGGGSGSTLYLGGDGSYGGGNAADMSLQDVGCVEWAPSEFWFREQFRRMAQSYDQDAAYREDALRHYPRVSIADSSGVYQDVDGLTGDPCARFVRRVFGDDDVDDTMHAFSVELDRQIGLYNLSQYVDGSTNPISGAMDVMRQIRVEVAAVPQGRSYESIREWEWQLYREGWISRINIPDGPGGQIVLECYDPMLELARCYIPTQRTYSDDTSPDTLGQVLQDYVDDNASILKTGTAYTVWDKDAAAWAPIEHELETQHLSNALSNKANDIGFDCLFKPDWVRQEYRLTLFEPPRAVSATDYLVLQDEHFDIEPLVVDETYVINTCYGEFINRAGSLNEAGNYPIASITPVTDATSVNAYGPRNALITEGTGSEIDTDAEMTDLAEAVVHDGKIPKATFALRAPFAWFTDLQDNWSVAAQGSLGSGDPARLMETHDSLIACTVTGHSWELGDERAQSILRLRQSLPIGKHVKWGDRYILPGGMPNAPQASEASIAVDASDFPILGPGIAMINLANRAYVGNGNLDRNNDQVQWHVGGSSGFTPGPSTLLGQSRGGSFVADGLTPGVANYIKAVPVDRRGQQGTPSAAQSFIPWYTGPLVAPVVAARFTGSDTATYGTSPTHLDIEQGGGGVVTEDIDNQNVFAAATCTLTVIATGLHHIECHVDLPNINGIWLYRNTGGGYTQFVEGIAGNGVGAISGNFGLNAGDLIRIYVQCSSAGNRAGTLGHFGYHLVQQTA